MEMSGSGEHLDRAGQQLATPEERRQSLEQRSAAKLTDEVQRVREQISKQLQANISQKQLEEEQRRAEQQQERLKQIEAASARAVEAHKADEEKAYLTWLSEQKLDVKNGIPNRPMFKEEFEKHWKKKSVAVPAWDLGVFGTSPQQPQPVPQYKKREDGTWRWQERDYAAILHEQTHHPLCKSTSRKLSVLGPVEPASAPDPDNALARLAAEMAEAATKESAAAKQQRSREAGRRPKKTSSQHAAGSHRIKRTVAAADEQAAAAAGASEAGKAGAAHVKAVSAGAEANSNAATAAVNCKSEVGVVGAEATPADGAASEATAAAAAAGDRKQDRMAKNNPAEAAEAAAAAAGTGHRKGSSVDFSERMSNALHKAARKLKTFGSFGSFNKRSAASNTSNTSNTSN